MRFSLSPDCDAAMVRVKKVSTGSTLEMKIDNGIVVPGLRPDTEYEVCVSARSKFGWLPDSPWVKFRTLKDGDVEITGTKTQAERDAEAKKRAVDVDAEDDGEPERVEKRAKPER